MYMNNIGYRDSQIDMSKVAKILVEECAAVKKGELVIVASDDSQSRNVYMSTVSAAYAAGAESSLLLYPTPNGIPIGQWVKQPRSVLSVLKDADAMICCGKTHPYWDLYEMVETGKTKARVLFLTGMTEDSIIRTIPVDYHALTDEMMRLKGIFDDGSRIKVISPRGTDIAIDIEGCETKAARGSFTVTHPDLPTPHGVEFLPAGRLGTFLPLGAAGDGTIVIDSFLGLGMARGKVIIEVRNGRVSVVRGEGAEHWYVEGLRKLFALDENANHVCEIGIGTNPMARLTGCYEDYGVRGSVRFGFGGTATAGVASVLHSDGFELGATMEIDGKPLIKDGELIAANK